MDTISSSLNWLLSLVYVDDIAINSCTLPQHVSCNGHVLTFLEKVDVTSKLRTCTVFTKKIDQLVHVNRPAQPKVASSRTRGIRE